MEALVGGGFDAAMEKASTTFAPLSRVSCFDRDFDEDAARHSSPQEAMGRITLIKQLQEDIDSMRQHYSVGLFLIDAKDLKRALTQVPLRALRALSDSPEPHPEVNSTLEQFRRKEEARASMTVTMNTTMFAKTGSVTMNTTMFKSTTTKFGKSTTTRFE
jgi:hypothetical protein